MEARSGRDGKRVIRQALVEASGAGRSGSWPEGRMVKTTNKLLARVAHPCTSLVKSRIVGLHTDLVVDRKLVRRPQIVIDQAHFRDGHSLLLCTKKMSGLFQRDPRAGAFLGGDRVSGQDVRDQNGLFSLSVFFFVRNR